MVVSTELIEKIKAAYIAKRRVKLPNYRPGRDLDSAAPGMAANCAELRVSPEFYIDCLHRHYAAQFDKFYPNMLKGDRAKSIVQEELGKYAKLDVGALWETQLRVLKSAIDNTGRPAENILYDGSMPFTAWFRVVLLKTPDNRILDKYLEKAKREVNASLLDFLEAKGVNVKRLRE